MLLALVLFAQILARVGTVDAFCSSCSANERAFEEFKQQRQDQILKDLLKKLDLPAKPNISIDYDNLPAGLVKSNPRLEALLEQSRRENNRRLFESTQHWRSRQTESGGEPEYFPTLYEAEQEPPPQSSYILAQRTPDWFDQVGALFTFSASLRKKAVRSARLNVFLRRPLDPLRYNAMTPIQIRVFRRFPNGSLSPMLASTVVTLDLSTDETARFEQFDVQMDEEQLQEWIQSGAEFASPDPEDEQQSEQSSSSFLARDDSKKASAIALYVEAIFAGENLVKYEDDDDMASSGTTMFLELELDALNAKKGRSRRNLNICRAGQNHTQKCCLYDLVIDFEKIGWNFVIAPKRYNAYVCNGECTGVGAGMSMSRSQAVAGAKADHFTCCHPREYAGITILYVMENNEVMARTVPNMVAKDCGCS